jgi:glyoxylase-like metal-dependent hydrolase (beta-lactamase superfamily II)
MIKITDHVYAETKYEGANLGCIVTQRGLVLVDSPTLPGQAREWYQDVSKLHPKGVAYLINTDHHYDHILTDSLLTRNTIAHRLAAKGIQYMAANFRQVIKQLNPKLYEDNKEILDGVEVIPPHITFNTEMTLHMGDRTIELSHVGGHAPPTIMIHVPEDKVLFTGDNVEVQQHSFTGEGRFASWIEVLRRIEGMDLVAIVPGHGDICGIDAARRMRLYFEEARRQVKDLRSQGYNREQVVKGVKLTDFSPVDPERRAERDVAGSIALDVGRMFDQMERGLL